jgi:ribosomal protein S11
MLKMLKESVEKLPRSGFVHLAISFNSTIIEICDSR